MLWWNIYWLELEGWMPSALPPALAAFTHGSVLTYEKMDIHHHLLIFQSLELSLASLELLNLLLQFLNTYKKR